jgi:hypothetical protein
MTLSPFDDPDSTEEERDAWRAYYACGECHVSRGIPHRDGCSGQFREARFGELNDPARDRR